VCQASLGDPWPVPVEEAGAGRGRGQCGVFLNQDDPVPGPREGESGGQSRDARTNDCNS